MHRQQQLAKQQRGERSHRQTGRSGLAGYLFGVRGAGCGVGYQAAQRWTGVLSWLWPNCGGAPALQPLVTFLTTQCARVRNEEPLDGWHIRQCVAQQQQCMVQERSSMS
jgi:hypothetical protein